MTQLVGWFASFGTVMLVVLGFGLIIFVHELGHFVAAKWAGIRVLAFALGFGPAIGSWRKGLGLCRGSSEARVQRLREEAEGPAGERRERARSLLSGISPTEYRLNWLPLGGYVKMLGQDDLDPASVSTAPDSYQKCPVWKRMVVISAGVVMNVVTAAVLFICVFMRGLETEPAKVGMVDPGRPASRAIPADRSVPDGLRPGDRVLSINGDRAQSFNDLMTASAMSGRGEALHLVVERRGVDHPIEFSVTPEPSDQTHLMEIGVTPSFSATLHEARTPAERELFAKVAKEAGYPSLEPGMRLVRVGGITDVLGAADLSVAVAAAGGEPVDAVFEGENGRAVTVQVRPRAKLQSTLVKLPTGGSVSEPHLLGLVPLMKVAGGVDGDPGQNLKVGDIFARVGAVEFPSPGEGTAEIKRHSGKTIEIDVLRQGSDGLARVSIKPDPTVHPENGGVLGFLRGDTADESTLVALPPATVSDTAGDKAQHPSPAASVITRPGTRIVRIEGTPVSDFSQIRAALRAATRKDFDAKAEHSRVMLGLELPLEGRPIENVEWTLDGGDVRVLHELGWESTLGLELFQPEQFVLEAHGGNLVSRAGNAVEMGLHETRRVMQMTYVTFARLFQGTVKVEHLRGPVGIAHMGTQVADRGPIWLLFFMALISVNLAVVNFLPLPIVDGGQFIFLVLEGIRGKPVSVQVQNIATIAGLILIGTMFLIVTFNDVSHLFG